MVDCKSLYEELKESRIIKGKLTIRGFGKDEYEELYYSLLEEMITLFDGDYNNWYDFTNERYIKYKKVTNKTNVYIPQESLQTEYHDIQMQLAVIKFYLYRRSTSGYKTKNEMETY